jgi:hypothetical protein
LFGETADLMQRRRPDAGRADRVREAVDDFHDSLGVTVSPRYPRPIDAL